GEDLRLVPLLQTRRGRGGTLRTFLFFLLIRCHGRDLKDRSGVANDYLLTLCEAWGGEISPTPAPHFLQNRSLAPSFVKRAPSRVLELQEPHTYITLDS